MPWTIREPDLAITAPGALATVFTVGNGALCTRGDQCEDARGVCSGTYVSGAFTKLSNGMHYFMDAPAWFAAWVEHGGVAAPVTASERSLDLRSGVLTRTCRVSCGGGELELVEERFMSFARPNVACQRLTVTAKTDLKGEVAVVTGLSGEVRKGPSKYFKKPGEFGFVDEFGVRTARVAHADACPDGVVVELESETGITSAAWARVRQTAGPEVAVRYSAGDGRALVRHVVKGGLEKDASLAFEKVAVLCADRGAPGNSRGEVDKVVAGLGDLDYAKALTEHAEALGALWEGAEVSIEGGETWETGIRYAMWATWIASPDNDGLSSIGPRNLNGDLYRGAVFWDSELFPFPVLAATAPNLARSHLRYRYRNTGVARSLATEQGYTGANYPFQLWGLGLEIGPRTHYTSLQVHVNVIISWAIRHYYTLTADHRLMVDGGLEIYLETCRFWQSRIERDARGVCHIRRVCGPDEFKRHRVDDNAYTNLMVGWTLRSARELCGGVAGEEGAAGVVSALLSRLGIGDATFDEWEKIADALYVPVIEATGTLEEYEGYEEIPEPDTRLNNGAWGFVDKSLKQADTILLWHTRIPFAYSDDMAMLGRVWREYGPITHHLSSLSYCSHALTAIRLGLLRDATRFFALAEGIDLNENGCHDGSRGGGLGGVWFCTIHGFGGLHVDGSSVAIRPKLPPFWRKLDYRFRYHGRPMAVEVLPATCMVRNLGDRSVRLVLADQAVTIEPGRSATAATAADWTEQGLEGVLFALPTLVSGETGAPEARPGAIELLRALRESGVRTAIVSDSESVPTAFVKAGLTGLVDAWADPSVTQLPWPDADTFKVGAMRLRMFPWNAVAIVDSPAAAEAARAAGLATVAVGPAIPGAGSSVPSLADATLERLAGLLDR